MVEVGAQAMHRLIDLMASQQQTESLELPTQLVVRESCGCSPH